MYNYLSIQRHDSCMHYRVRFRKTNPTSVRRFTMTASNSGRFSLTLDLLIKAGTSTVFTMM